MMSDMTEQPRRDERGKLILSPEARARVAARARQLSAACRELLDQLADRLPTDVLDRLERFQFAGEWALVVDELAAVLTRRHIPITAAERDLLRNVLHSFGSTTALDTVLASLTVTDAQ
jgi:hypothetical protein